MKFKLLVYDTAYCMLASMHAHVDGSQVVNHGMSESLMKGMIDACRRFFDLTEEEKREFHGTHVLDPIRCGTSFNPTVENVLFWRDFLKVFVHPRFHFPGKPAGFRYRYNLS